MEKLPNSWTNWHQIRYTSVDSSGIGHRLKTIRPTIPKGGILGFLWGQQFKRLGNVVKRLDRLGLHFAHIMQMNLGMDTGGQIGPMRHQGEHFDGGGVKCGHVFGVLGESIFHQNSGECHNLQRRQITINFLKVKSTNRL